MGEACLEGDRIIPKPRNVLQFEVKTPPRCKDRPVPRIPDRRIIRTRVEEDVVCGGTIPLEGQHLTCTLSCIGQEVTHWSVLVEDDRPTEEGLRGWLYVGNGGQGYVQSHEVTQEMRETTRPYIRGTKIDPGKDPGYACLSDKAIGGKGPTRRAGKEQPHCHVTGAQLPDTLLKRDAVALVTPIETEVKISRVWVKGRAFRVNDLPIVRAKGDNRSRQWDGWIGCRSSGCRCSCRGLKREHDLLWRWCCCRLVRLSTLSRVHKHGHYR